MNGTRLVPMTTEQRDGLVADCGAWLDDITDAYDAAPEPVTRRRCTTHDAEHVGNIDQCWAYSWQYGEAGKRRGSCIFVDELCVPKPEEPA